MDGWGTIVATTTVGMGFLAWRISYVYNILANADDAWRQTEDLLGKRQEIAHQIVLYADQTGHWNQQLMDRLVQAAANTRTYRDVRQRLKAEHELSRSIYLAISYLAKNARSDETDEINLIQEYWQITERKIDFAQSYYRDSAKALHHRFDRKLARAMVKLRVVPGGILDVRAA